MVSCWAESAARVKASRRASSRSSRSRMNAVIRCQFLVFSQGAKNPGGEVAQADWQDAFR
jgi:hypothetical protein